MKLDAANLEISIIIPFYIELEVISSTVESIVAACKGLTYEVLICNDGGIPNRTILKKAQETLDFKIDLKVLNNRDLPGAAGARNTGIDTARYSWIAFLDADDLWLPNKICDQIEAIKTGATFICSPYQLDKGTVIHPPKTINKPTDIFLKRGISTSTVLVHKTCIGETRFRALKHVEDIDMWFRLATNTCFTYAHTNKVAMKYSTEGSTSNKWLQLRLFSECLFLNRIGIILFVRTIFGYTTRGVWNHFLQPTLNRIIN